MSLAAKIDSTLAQKESLFTVYKKNAITNEDWPGQEADKCKLEDLQPGRIKLTITRAHQIPQRVVIEKSSVEEASRALLSMIGKRGLEGLTRGSMGNSAKTSDGHMTVQVEGTTIEDLVASRAFEQAAASDGPTCGSQDPRYCESKRRFNSVGEAIYVCNFLAEDGVDFYADLKELARSDDTVLSEILNLLRYREEDESLNSKEARGSMDIILKLLYEKNPLAAHYMGTMKWEPELVNWKGFLNQKGDQSPAEWLGVASMGDIPLGQARGQGMEPSQKQVPKPSAPEGPGGVADVEEPLGPAAPAGPGGSSLASAIARAIS